MLRAILLAFRLATFALVFFCLKAVAQSQLPAETQQKIDKVATDALAKTGVPSASVAVVKDGQIVYLRAYGNARLDPETAAKPETQERQPVTLMVVVEPGNKQARAVGQNRRTRCACAPNPAPGGLTLT